MQKRKIFGTEVFLAFLSAKCVTIDSRENEREMNTVEGEGRNEERERLEKQIQFIVEADKVKNIFRQTYLADGRRNEDADVARVMIMVLIHDLVEIDAGDTYAYDEKGAQTKREREVKAAERIFGILPEDQGRYFRELWEEFEAYETPEAKFAHLLDNFQPILLNDASGGKSWVEHGVHKSQPMKRNERIPGTSDIIWEKMQEIFEKHVENGNLKAD